MVDANQVWEVQEAIDWMTQLAKFKPLWIEEPTSPDDVLGHAQISKALKPLGISVASGEMCCNRVLFKQFLQADAIQYCQIDSARIGGVNEILSVYLMAKKLGGKDFDNHFKSQFSFLYGNKSAVGGNQLSVEILFLYKATGITASKENLQTCFSKILRTCRSDIFYCMYYYGKFPTLYKPG